MDFTPDADQQAIADLATQILSDRMTHEHLKELEAADSFFDRDCWLSLAKADLLGLGLSTDVGGSGLGLVEVGLVAEAQGRTVAPLPLLGTLAVAMTIDAHGSSDQRSGWLPGVIDGSVVFTPAFQEYLHEDQRSPLTSATPDGGGGFVLNGTKIVVEHASEAARMLVSATSADGTVLALVDPTAAGVTIEHGRTTRNQVVSEVALADVAVDAADVIAAGDGADEALGFALDRMLALLCCTQVGVTSTALKMTAEYTTSREQFGRPIATFQAVTQRSADAYIHTTGVRLTAYKATWLLANGQDAGEALHIAKYFASDFAQQVAHATQHLHGGIGVDVDYPLHRYTLWNKHIEVSMGAGNQHLRALGALMAS